MSHPPGHPGPHGAPPHQYQPGHHPGYPPAPPGGYTGPQVGGPLTTGAPNRSLEIAVGCFVVFLAVLAVVAGLWQFHAAGQLPVSPDPLTSRMRRESAGELHTFGTTFLLLASMGFIAGYLLLRGQTEVGITLMALVGFGAFGGGMVAMSLAVMNAMPIFAITCIGMVIAGVVMLWLTARQLSSATRMHPPRR